MVTMSITCLHISDLHFQSEGDLFSQDQVCDSLLRSIQEVTKDGTHAPTFAMVTGDIAYSGKSSEYEKAASFFNRLVSDTNIERSSVFFVPGNHDVDRSKHELAYYGAKNEINSIARVDYYLAHASRIQSLIERQRAFWSFVGEFTAGQQRIHSHDGLGYAACVDSHRPTICILGLNSSWLSGDSEENGDVAIGERQIINCIDLLKNHNPHLVVALAHHPISYLTEWDASSCHSRLLPAVDLFLRGHLHSPQVLLSSTPEAPCIEIAAGASHSTRFEANSYNIITIDPALGVCEVHCYQYTQERGRFDSVGSRTADITLRGSLSGSRSELADAIRRVVVETPGFENFMAGLLAGELSEVPLSVDGSVVFASPAVAPELIDDNSLRSIAEFFGLRNLLRLYDPTVSLEMRVADNATIIRRYSADLTKMVAEDPSCRSRLQNDQSSPATRTDRRGGRRWSVDLIGDLRRSEDWGELELLARTLAVSRDQDVRRVALAALVEALMHSDELPRREEAFAIASELVSADSPSAHEFVLAGAAAEVIGDEATAIRITQNAMRAGFTDYALAQYARSLSFRTGDRSLRQLRARHIVSRARER